MGIFGKEDFEKEKAKQNVEIQKLKGEAEKLRTESASRQEISREREELKQTRAEIQALKAELHPSLFSKLQKGIDIAERDLALGKYKKAKRSHKKHRKIVRMEKSHAQRRRKQLRSMF